MVKAGDDTAAVKRAYLHALVTVVQAMPEADQDFCLTEALKKTALQGQTERVDISSFSGRISEYILLGVRAIGVQLGDFTCFLNLIPGSTATDRKSTRLNSSHVAISYAVFCLKKKKII